MSGKLAKISQVFWIQFKFCKGLEDSSAASVLTAADESKANSSNRLGVIVMAPDGRIVRIGRSLLTDSKLKMETEIIKKSQSAGKSSESELVYRLFDKIPPYLFYTNKLDQNTVQSFDSPSSCKQRTRPFDPAFDVFNSTMSI